MFVCLWKIFYEIVLGGQSSLNLSVWFPGKYGQWKVKSSGYKVFWPLNLLPYKVISPPVILEGVSKSGYVCAPILIKKLYFVMNFCVGNKERRISSGARMCSPMAFHIQGVLLKILMKLRGICP